MHKDTEEHAHTDSTTIQHAKNPPDCYYMSVFRLIMIIVVVIHIQFFLLYVVNLENDNS